MRGAIKQICVVVRDVNLAMAKYWDICGLGPWDVRSFTNDKLSEFEVGGKSVTEPFEFICAVTWAGQIEFEIVQPVKGPNIYWDFLEKRGEGLHHVKFVMSEPEIDLQIAELEAKGYRVTQSGRIDGDVHYYLDTADDLALTIELGNGGQIGAPDYVFPVDQAVKSHRKPNFKQICLVSRDAERTMQAFWDVLGIGPWDVRNYTADNLQPYSVHGQKLTSGFEFVCAVTWFGDMQIEVVQPISGPNVYWDFIEKKGDYFHHVKDVMPDSELEAYIAKLDAMGYPVTQTGWIEEDLHAYIDTEKDLRMILELGNGGRIDAKGRSFPVGVN